MRTDGCVITSVPGLDDIPAHEWDGCACPEAASGRPCDPFTTHRFLSALERSGSVGPGTGWEPHHLILRKDGCAVSVAPLYAKAHSQGEYIFDHAFADAWRRSGGQYYPKLQVAVPFTPATGRRFLTAPGYETAGATRLIDAITRIAVDHRLSSAHVTFCTESEAALGRQAGLLHRVTEQFHWRDEGYGDFEGFLSALSSRKRKAVRKERATAQAFGGSVHEFTGDDILPEHWDAFWNFYQDTGARKWGQPYLTRAFFDEAQASLRHDILLIMAWRAGHWVAGALNFIGRDTLFGRYWGCVEDHPCLHFELCYYRAIDFALRNGLARVEAGAQGAHKLARGYLPRRVHSLHFFPDTRFRDAVSQYLHAERDAVDHEIALLSDKGPFRQPAAMALHDDRSGT